jgi:hypothetical protein
MKYTLKRFGECKREITHISIKHIDRDKKIDFGIAHHIGWLSMTDEGTIVTTATDDNVFTIKNLSNHKNRKHQDLTWCFL